VAGLVIELEGARLASSCWDDERGEKIFATDVLVDVNNITSRGGCFWEVLRNGLKCWFVRTLAVTRLEKSGNDACGEANSDQEWRLERFHCVIAMEKLEFARVAS
jgi:hypothetical protein